MSKRWRADIFLIPLVSSSVHIMGYFKSQKWPIGFEKKLANLWESAFWWDACYEMNNLKVDIWKPFHVYVILFLPEKKIRVSPIKVLISVHLKKLSNICWNIFWTEFYCALNLLLKVQKWNALRLVRKSNWLTSEDMKFSSRI